MKKIFLAILLLQILFVSKSFSQSYPRMENPNYTYTKLYDDFTSGQLLRNIWTPSSHTLKEGSENIKLYIFVDSTATIGQSNGNLNLSMIYYPNYTTTAWPWDGGGIISANFIAGEVSSNQSYSYGIYECNATFSNIAGSFPAFWTIGSPDCRISFNNEIDIVELKHNHPNPTLDNNIFLYPPQCGDPDSPFDDVIENPFTWGGPHTFKCIWAPSKIQYWVDGTMLNEIPNTGQNWYPILPQHVILSQQVINYNNTPPNYGVNTPQTSNFHWVKVREFFLAPEITVPELTCSTGTATLDVDPQATNITWQLTPAHFFTTTSGSGKTANFVRAANANGVGKITYTFQMPGGETFTAEKEILVGAQKPEIITYAMDAPPGRFTTFIEDVPTATSYNWYLNGVKNNTYHGTSAVFPRKSPFCDVYYRVQVEAINPCGTSAKTLLDIYEPSCFYSVLLSPNPSSSETTIELVYGEEKTPVENINWSLEVYDQSQNLKTKVSKEKENKHVIKTSDWEEGLYIIHAVVGDEIISEKLRVEH